MSDRRDNADDRSDNANEHVPRLGNRLFPVGSPDGRVYGPFTVDWFRDDAVIGLIMSGQSNHPFIGA